MKKTLVDTFGVYEVGVDEKGFGRSGMTPIRLLLVGSEKFYHREMLLKELEYELQTVETLIRLLF